MRDSRKKIVKNLFREGNKLMSQAIHSQLSPISDHGKSLREFKNWYTFVGRSYPKIRLYFVMTYQIALESARNEYHKLRYKDHVTGELLSSYDTERIMLHEYNKNQMLSI